MKPILDVCCGGKQFYFEKDDPRVHFNDIRSGEFDIGDGRTIVVGGETSWDFTNLPCDDESYSLVVFDPPHLYRLGEGSWLKAKYGQAPKKWRPFIKKGFEECMRVLKPNGVLVMKWSSGQISAHAVLDAIGTKPVFGTKKSTLTYWWIFMKGGDLK